MTRKFRIAALVGLGLLAAIPLAWSEVFPSYTWRYKITVNVETPEGLKSGSAVREVTNRDNTILGVKFPEAGARISKVKGEAVVIDLGKRGVLFGLIDHDSYRELYSAFSVRDPSNTSDDFHKLDLGMKADLNIDRPKIITFKDMNDPKSIEIVYQQKMGSYIGKVLDVDDNFEKLFGAGVVLKSISIEITGEKITWGKIHGYLGKLHSVGPYEFVQGAEK